MYSKPLESYQPSLTTLERKFSVPTWPNSIPLGGRTKLSLLDRMSDPSTNLLKQKHLEDTELPPPKKQLFRTSYSSCSRSAPRPATTSMTSSLLALSEPDTVRPTCLGSEPTQGGNQLIISPAVQELASCSSFTEKISPALSSLSERPRMPPRVSSPPSGNVSLRESCLISTISCLQSSALQSMKTGRRALERHSSLLARMNQKGKSVRTAIGSQRGDVLRGRLPSPSRTEGTNSKIISSTSRPSSVGMRR